MSDKAAPAQIVRELVTATLSLYDRPGSNAVEIEAVDADTLRELLTDLEG